MGRWLALQGWLGSAIQSLTQAPRPVAARLTFRARMWSVGVLSGGFAWAVVERFIARLGARNR